METITPCIWFDNQAEQAVEFYTTLFRPSTVSRALRYTDVGTDITGKRAGELMYLEYELEGIKFAALNGGPEFKPNPSISFFIRCETKDEVEQIWSRLSSGGHTLMELKKYPWSGLYGWIQDKFGVSWQIAVHERDVKLPRITPCLLFLGSQQGGADEAMKFYTSQFEGFRIMANVLYKAGENGTPGSTKFGLFEILNYPIIVMDGTVDHGYRFSEGISFVIECDTQEQIDRHWNRLTTGGDSKAQQCGWLKDKFGISWQVVPRELFDLIEDHESPRAKSVIRAMLNMKKLDLIKLRSAAV